MGKLDKLKSQIPQGSQELSTKNHLAKTEIAMSFQNEGTELTRILLRLNLTPITSGPATMMTRASSSWRTLSSAMACCTTSWSVSGRMAHLCCFPVNAG